MKFYIIFVLFFINVGCQETTCDKPCSLVFDPVCAGPVLGFDKLITFRNLCYLDSYNCKHPQKGYEVKRQGVCYPL